MLKHFHISEFACPCCGECQMNIDTLLRFDKARMIADTPFKMNSGYRCRKHNLEVGSTSENHPSGHAGDIECTESWQRIRILIGLIKAGFKRIGIHKTFIHADDMDKVESCWLY